MSKILARVRAVRPRPEPYPGAPVYLTAGEDVTTSDGQTWFHPYSGAAPHRVETKEPRRG